MACQEKGQTRCGRRDGGGDDDRYSCGNRHSFVFLYTTFIGVRIIDSSVYEACISGFTYSFAVVMVFKRCTNSLANNGRFFPIHYTDHCIFNGCFCFSEHCCRCGVDCVRFDLEFVTSLFVDVKET